MASPTNRRRLLIALAISCGGIAYFVLDVNQKRKEYEALDLRIDGNIPKDRGIQAASTFVTDTPAIHVSLDRLEADDKEKARTRIRIGGSEWILPSTLGSGVSTHDDALEARRDAVFALVEARIRELHAADASLKGAIDTSPPKGGDVPHADIMKVIDSFLGAGITEINFQGAAAPIPKATR